MAAPLEQTIITGMSESTSTTAPPRPAHPQLTLWQLLVLVTVVGVGFGAYPWVRWFALPLAGTALWYVATSYGWIRGRIEHLVVLVLVLIFAIHALVDYRAHWVQRTRPYSTIKCRNQLRQVGVALAIYHDLQGSYPPIATYSESGRPLHSWRTHILSQIERADLTEMYDFTEPWDGPTNSALHGQNLRVFSCPLDPGRNTAQVSYLAIIDPRTKPGEPFAVIEVPNSGINFFEPRDVTIAELLSPQSPLARNTRGPHGYYGSYHLLLKNGSVEQVTLEQLQQRLRDGKL